MSKCLQFFLGGGGGGGGGGVNYPFNVFIYVFFIIK